MVRVSQLPIASSVASDDYLTILDTSERALKRATVNHASATNAFGLSTTDEYGHTKIVDDLSKSTFANGEALAAHQGNILANLIAPTEVSPSTAAYEIDDYLIFDNNFWKVISAISVGDNLVEGTNIEMTTVGKELQNRGGGGIDIVQIPTVIIEEYTYNGSEQGPTITGLDATKVNVTDATATDPGTYTMVLSLKDPTTMVWSDLTNTSKSYQYTISLVGIYGISWDGGSNSAWTRTDAAENFIDPVPAVNNGDGSSPFDNILPWSGMQIVEDPIAGTLVSIPKYYYKWTKTGTAMKLQISSSPQNGFHVSPAHANRDDGHGERDVVYVGRYHCSAFIKSETNSWPRTDTIAEGRTKIHELGNEYWQYDFAMYWTIMMLYLVEYADWNSQKKIGYGCGNNSNAENSGTTDGMIYHTGTNATNRTTYGHTQYRHIEDLWGNAMDWCDGIYVTSNNVYIINNPANYSNTYVGTKIGTHPGGASGGIIASFEVPTESGFEWALYPKNFTSNTSTYNTKYVCDEANYYPRSRSAVSIGGTWNQTLSYGAFAMNLGADYSTSGSGYGERLQKLPNNT